MSERPPDPADRSTPPLNDPPATDEDVLEDLVAECLERMATEGESAVDAICLAHPELADEVRLSLRALRDVGLTADTDASDEIPERLGAFKLLSRIGAGGMGVVYLAEQEPLGREVALKLVRPDHLYFPGARLRFQQEVTAAARLQHPGIVPVYTVGEEKGIPYFAMEYIAGPSLAEVLGLLEGKAPESLTGRDLKDAVSANGPDADPPGQDTPDDAIFEETHVHVCLNIARQVAYALEHAHARGIIHRDVKPSNILLTSTGRAMLLDFGIARAEGASRMTRTGSTVGSLLYMAPEQLSGEPGSVGPRTDIYGLGITLYELLALAPAHDVGSTETTRRSILEGRPASLRAANRRVAWDVETVCLTAMEKDPARRYATAADFARDLENVLRRRPIEARRAGALLRVRRWLQRHPTLSATAGAVLLLIGIGATVFALQERQARVKIGMEKERAVHARDESDRQRDLARVEAKTAEDVAEFLVDLFRHSLPARAQGRDVTAREILDEGIERIEVLADQPSIQAGLMRVMGQVYAAISELDTASRLLEDSLEICRQRFGEADLRTVIVLFHLGSVRHAEGKLEEAERLLRRTLVLLEPHLDAESAARETEASCLTELAHLLKEKADKTEAEQMAREALAIAEAECGDRAERTVAARMALAAVLERKGEFPAAERLLRTVLGPLKAIFGGRHPNVAVALNTLAIVLKRQGKFEEAATHYREALGIARAIYEKDHPDIAATLFNLAPVLERLGKLEQAERSYRGALEIAEARLDEDHDLVILGRAHLGLFYANRNDFKQAEPLLARALPALISSYAERPELVRECQVKLAQSCHALGEIARAEKLYRKVVPGLRKAREETDPLLTQAVKGWADALSALDRGREAIPLYEKVLPHFERHGESFQLIVAEIHQRLGLAVLEQRKFERAESHFRANLEIREKQRPAKQEDVSVALYYLGIAHARQREFAEDDFLERSVQLERGRPDPDWTLGLKETECAYCFIGLDRLQDAEPMLKAGYQRLARAKEVGPRHPVAIKALRALARVYELLDRPKEAARCRTRLEKAGAKVK